MALILADTDVLIDFLAGREPTARRVEQLLVSGVLLTSCVTRFELLVGATGETSGDRVRELCEAIEALPLDPESSTEAARVHRALRDRGLTIGMADSLIAGIALRHRMPLLTNNVKHFSRVPELRLIEADSAP